MHQVRFRGALRASLLAPALAAMLLLGACRLVGVESQVDPAAARVRAELTDLQSDPALASRAPMAINEAEQAVRAAEKAQSDKQLAAHLVYVAGRKVETARLLAQARYAEDQLKSLAEQRAQVQLAARTREADRAKAQVQLLLQQLAQLQSRQTQRGLEFTLGDVLFAVGKADLAPGAASNLGKLAEFLAAQPDRRVTIEGYTDSRGSKTLNQQLSQARANSVKAFLVDHGVDGDHITAVGRGDADPVASNSTPEGRQQNRRVEVTVENSPEPSAPG